MILEWWMLVIQQWEGVMQAEESAGSLGMRMMPIKNKQKD